MATPERDEYPSLFFGSRPHSGSRREPPNYLPLADVSGTTSTNDILPAPVTDCAATVDIWSKAWDGDPPSDEEVWLHPDNCDRLLWFIANSRPLALTVAIENELTADLPDPGPPKHRDRPNPVLEAARTQIHKEFLAEGRALEGPFFDQAFFTARVHMIYWAHGPL
ncbi:hypothetical protein ACEPAI_8226 [Sanghuangporus weigelae]